MPVSTVLSGSIISLFLLLPLVTLSSQFEKKLLVQSLAFLGVVSLSIYVMHTMFSETIRILLIQTGTFNLAAHLFLGVSFGVIGPVLVYLWLRRVRLLRVVGLA